MEVMVPPPETNDHVPFPTEGLLAFSDVVVEQIVWFAPALEEVGCKLTITVVVFVEEQVPVVPITV